RDLWARRTTLGLYGSRRCRCPRRRMIWEWESRWLVLMNPRSPEFVFRLRPLAHLFQPMAEPGVAKRTVRSEPDDMAKRREGVLETTLAMQGRAEMEEGEIALGPNGHGDGEEPDRLVCLARFHHAPAQVAVNPEVVRVGPLRVL